MIASVSPQIFQNHLNANNILITKSSYIFFQL